MAHLLNEIECSICNSTDFYQNEDSFVCRICGTTYSGHEIKIKEMQNIVEITGTVKEDVSDKLKNLYDIARRSRKTEEFESAQKYYEIILMKDANSWEAYFFSIYYKAILCKIDDIYKAAASISKCIPYVLDLVHQSQFNKHEQEEAITDIYQSLKTITKLFYDTVDNHFHKINNKADYFDEWIKNCYSITTILDIFASNLESRFAGNYQKYMVDCWKNAVEIRYILIPVDKKTNREILRSWEEKIRKYEPEYKNPQEQGCYIATVVYGSYQCPEVWTLRRFRDDILNPSRCGKMLVRMYYYISPFLINKLGRSKYIISVSRKILDLLVKNLTSKGVLNTPYVDK